MSAPAITERVYFAVFGALMVLLAMTVGVAYVDLGPLNVPIMLAIAVVKALLIILYFMHVRYASHLTWMVVAVGFFWLLLLIVLTMMDYLSRAWLPPPAGWVG